MYQEHSVLATVTLKQSKLRPEELSSTLTDTAQPRTARAGKRDHGLWVLAAYVHQLKSCMSIGRAWWSPQDYKQQRKKYSAQTGTPVNRDELVQTNLTCRPQPHNEQEGKKTNRRTCQRRKKKVHTQKNCSLKNRLNGHDHPDGRPPSYK